MRILLVAATAFEIAPTIDWMKAHLIEHGSYFVKGELEVVPRITGVGIPSTVYHLTKIFSANKIDLAIQAGIAGTFRSSHKKGDVVQVLTERYGDLGAEKADGQFIDLVEMKLLQANASPFTDGILKQPDTAEPFLPPANGLTVNKVHGYASSIQRIIEKYDPDIESMEGAPFFEVCLREKIPFLSIRSISNLVEPRNTDNWDIPLAIDQLNKTVVGVLESFV